MNIFDALNLINNSKGKSKKKTSNKKPKRKRKIKDSFDKSSIFSLFNLIDDTPLVIDNEKKDKKEVENNTIENMVDIISEFTNKTKSKISKVLDFILEKKQSEPKDSFKANIDAIKTIKSLDGKLANESQQKIISQYSGWGALANKFNEGQESNELLKSLLTNEEYESVKKSTLTGFFTDFNTVKYIYNVLTRLGFEKGRILEPSVGAGAFLKYMPSQMYFSSQIVGVELDSITATISKNLYQSSKILNCPFQETELKNDSFDCILGNVPFGDIKIFDTFDEEFNKSKLFIHDYYFLKSIKKVRDKGLIAFITTAGTMDKRNSSVREEIDKTCSFLGAVRLGSGSFKGTDVTADIIFLQKDINKNSNINNYEENEDEEEEKETKTKRYTLNLNWLNSFEYENTGVFINEYFINNPQMVIGTLEEATNQFGKCLKVKPSDDIQKALNQTIKYFESDIYCTPLDDLYMFEDDELLENTDETIKNGELIIFNDKIYQKQKNKLVPNSYTGIRQAKLFAYIEIKDLVKLIIKEELMGCTDERLSTLQSELNSKYDDFVKKYGFINHRSNKKILDDDILYTIISAIETYDSENKVYCKSDIFTKRTLCVKKTFEPETVNDAVMLSYSTYGCIDIDFMAEKLNYSVDELKKELLESKLFFVDPLTQKLIYRDEYLSGNVKEKLELAENALNSNSTFKANVEALKEVQPEYISDVSFGFISTWIPNEIKEGFVAKTLNIPKNKIKIIYNPIIGYNVLIDTFISYDINNVIWGTERRSAVNIINIILNLGEMTVYDLVEVDGKEKRVKNVEETQLAMSKETAWKLEFNKYINENPDLLREITDIYNSKFNCYREREYHNIFKVLNINPEITLRDYQLKAASRAIISNRCTLLHHSVGAGKSFTASLISESFSKIGVLRYKKSEMTYFSNSDRNNDGVFMKSIDDECVRVKSKTLIVVPNHLAKSGTFAKEYLTLFPNANILSTSPDDFRKTNRRKLIAKIATGDWTAIIIPVSVLGLIPLKPSTELKLLEEDLKELMETIEFLNKNSDNRISVKALEKEKENFLVKIKKLNNIHIDEGLLFWEDLGITNIICDEFHLFKSLFCPRKIQIKGISMSSSKRASDLFNKIRYQRSQYKGNVLIGLSATPVSNSMAEVYILAKYFLQKSELYKFGIPSFDAFAANFGDINNVMEIDPTGTSFRLTRRFDKFINVKELIDMYRTFTDVVNINEVKDVSKDLPKLIGNAPQIRITEPTPEVTEFIDGLVERAAAIKDGKVTSREDNMLKVVLDGRLVAISPRLVGINQDSAKLKQCAMDIAQTIKDYPEGTNLVFCDLGTPKSECEYSAYQELKSHCINAGIAESDIKFIHDAKTTQQFTKMMDDFREAKFRVLIASSSKASTGLNVQNNIKSLYHLDSNWKPSEIQQRRGRMIRIGCKNKEVFERRYILNSSFDAYMWQTVEFKSKFINQLMSGNCSQRVVSDLEEETMSYEQCKACASNNPLLFELANINKEIQEITILEKAHKKELIRSARNKENAKLSLQNLTEIMKDVEFDKNNLDEDKKDLILYGFEDNDIVSKVENLSKVMKTTETKKIGEIYGLEIYIDVDKTRYSIDRLIRFGKSRTRVEWKVYPKLLFEALLNINETLKERYSNISERISKYEAELKTIDDISKNSFSRQDELNKLKMRKVEIETELSLKK